MEKTTVYLSSAQKEALARTAAAEGRSEARLIRAGIDIVTLRHRVGGTAERLEPAAQASTASAGDGDGAIGRPRWMTRDAFVGLIVRNAADAALRDELRELSPDLTDEDPLP